MIHFTKMHGLGNDFVVIDAISQSISIEQIDIPTLAHRHLGIGFDQLLIIQSSQSADFACRFFNSNGSEAEQCGNGVRCVARFIHEKKLSQKKSLQLETKAGIVTVVIHDYDTIEVAMGIPIFAAEKIPYQPALATKLNLAMSVLSMGNPHAVLQVDSIQDAPVSELGQKIATHPAFPESVNVGFMEIVNRQHIRLRTYERGVGETCACGSNACAAVVAGIMNHLLDHKVKVELAFGDLWIEWRGENNSVVMTGPATRVFDGSF